MHVLKIQRLKQWTPTLMDNMVVRSKFKQLHQKQIRKLVLFAPIPLIMRCTVSKQIKHSPLTIRLSDKSVGLLVSLLCVGKTYLKNTVLCDK